MSNPHNNMTLQGRLTADPIFLTNRNGEEFQARFNLAVRRNFKTREGKYESDFLPIRYSGQKRIDFVHRLTSGTGIIVSGAMRSEKYEKDGATVYAIYVEAESISYPLNNKRDDDEQNTVPTQETNTTQQQNNVPVQQASASNDEFSVLPFD